MAGYLGEEDDAIGFKHSEEQRKKWREKYYENQEVNRAIARDKYHENKDQISEYQKMMREKKAEDPYSSYSREYRRKYMKKWNAKRKLEKARNGN